MNETAQARRPPSIALDVRSKGQPSTVTQNFFFIGLILAASGLVSPPIALAGGLIDGFSFVHPFHIEAKKLSKILLQASVVGLGFGMDLHQVMQAGRAGFIYTATALSQAETDNSAALAAAAKVIPVSLLNYLAPPA